jgi:hypothetical protein
MPPLRVLVEAGQKRVFACALDLVGLARSGRTEEAAIEALRAALPRYQAVAAEAGVDVPLDATTVEVVERVTGNATTDFGAPGVVGDVDGAPLSNAEAERQARLVAAAWAVFERTSAQAPEALRKGPRGGGRDRSKIVRHLDDADRGYATSMGIRETGENRRTIDEVRREMLEVLGRPSDGAPLGGKRWPSRYAARRVAWHALDHAWEIEDRSQPE